MTSVAKPSSGQSRASGQEPPKSSFLDLIRIPDQVRAFAGFEKTLPSGEVTLNRRAERWEGKHVVVETRVDKNSVVLTLQAPATPMALVHARWRFNVSPGLLFLGDAWERSYGELGWRSLVPERSMPWYFATYDRTACHGYGVKTDSAALCFWQLDPDGVSLWLNVTSGGNGVELSQRQLTMATVSRQGSPGDDPIDDIRELCRLMCARPSRAMAPVYGANDWDYAYGQSSAETILRDTDFIAELSPTAGPRPFSVIDGGWANGTASWPDMGKLAADIKRRNVRPGLWIRPLEAPQDSPRQLLLSDNRFGDRKERAREFAFDPTIPESKEKIRAKMRQAVEWGYEMVKHDFSTYDLLGQWGFEMGPQPTLPGWSFFDRSRTNAEVIADLYAMLREAAGDKALARWLQHHRAPLTRRLRPATHRRRHERPSMGTYPPHGREHPGLPAAAAGNLLHRRSRHGWNYRFRALGTQPAMARRARPKRSRDHRCGGSNAPRAGAARRAQRGISNRRNRRNRHQADRLDGHQHPGTMACECSKP